MSPFAILSLSLAMSADAFAAALAKGARAGGVRWSDALRVGLVFGLIEAITPLIGWLLGAAAAQRIAAWDHWIAFALLGALGVHMVYKSMAADNAEGDAASMSKPGGGLLTVALAGLATSIDAMAVGVGLAFVDVNILVVAAAIGVSTFLLVTLGVMAGRALGAVAGKRAEAAGGIVLILIGVTILRDHLGHATA